jgi:hypothetical protein
MKRIENRIQDLESKWRSDAVVLHFADGSTKMLRGPKYFLGGLAAAAARGARCTSEQEQQLQLIRLAAYAEEPGGGRMIELIKVMMIAADVDPSLNPELDACETASQ